MKFHYCCLIFMYLHFLRLLRSRCAFASSPHIQVQQDIRGNADEQIVARSFPFPLRHVFIAETDRHNGTDRENFFTLKVEVDNGLIQPASFFIHGIWIRQSKDEYTHFFSGTVQKINSFLADGNVLYKPPYFDYEGQANITFYLINGLMEKEEHISRILGHKVITLQILPDLAMDLIITPPTAVIWEDERLSFTKYPITLKFSGLSSKVTSLECSVTAKYGLIDHHFLLGSGVNVTSHFSQISYMPGHDYNGIDQVQIICQNHQLRQRCETSFRIIIKAVDDKPAIVAPKTSFTVYEDEEIILGRVAGVFIIDTDAHEQSLSAVIVILTITTDPLTYPNFDLQTQLVYSIIEHSASSMLMIGSVDSVNRALEQLVIALPSNWFGHGSISISCDQYDITSRLPTKIEYLIEEVSEQIFFEVLSVNNAPRLHIKNTRLFVIVEDSYVSFNSSEISFDDADGVTTDQFRLHITVRGCDGDVTGSFHVHSEVPRKIISNHKDDPFCSMDDPFSTTLDLFGSISEISSSLNEIKWIPKQNWHGTIQQGVCISITDNQGLHDRATLLLHIVPFPDKPQLKATYSNVTLLEDTTVAISQLWNVSLIDADTEYHTNKLSLSFELHIRSSLGGYLSLNERIPGSYMIAGGEIDPSVLRVKGNIEVINHVLCVMKYTPPIDSDTMDTLNFHVEDDSGLNDHFELNVYFTPINDAPVIQASMPTYFYQDDGTVAAHFNSFDINDVDGDGEDNVTLKIICTSNMIQWLDIYVDPEIKVTKNKKSHYEIHLAGLMNSVIEAMKSSNLGISLRSENEINSWHLKIEVHDKDDAFSEKVFTLPLPQQLNIFPQIIYSKKGTIKAVEDVPVDIGKHISFHGQNTDTLYEVSFMTKSQIIPNRVELSINYDNVLSCLNEGQFKIIVSDEVTQRLYLNVTDADFKNALEEISTISGAIVSRDHGLFTIKTLTFGPVQFDAVLFLSNETCKQICNPKISLIHEHWYDEGEELVKTWGLPSHIKGGYFSLSDLPLGGVHLMNYSNSKLSDSMVIRGKIQELNKAVGAVLYVPSPDFFGRARVDVILKTALNSYGLILGTTNTTTELFIDIESKDDQTSIRWNELDFADYEIVLESSVNIPIQFGRNLSLFDADYILEVTSCTIKVSAGKICEPYHTTTPSSDNVQSSLFQCGPTLTMNLIGIKDLAPINERLKTLIYEPKSMWTGIDAIDILLVSSSLMDQSIIPIHISGDVPPPYYISFDSYGIMEGVEDSTLELNGIVIRYDEELFHDMMLRRRGHIFVQVHLLITNGELFIENNGSFVSYHINKSTLQIKGHVEAINEALQSLRYVPTINFHGPVSMKIELLDGNRKYNEKIIPLFIKELNDAPLLIFPPIYYGHIFRIYEDTVSTIWSSKDNKHMGNDQCSERCWDDHVASLCCPLRIEDADSTNTSVFRLNFRTENGAMRLPRLSIHRNATKTYTERMESTFVENFQFYGNEAVLNDLLNGVDFVAKRNFNSRNGELARLHIEIFDEYNASSSMTLLFEIKPVNDRPILRWDSSHPKYHDETEDESNTKYGDPHIHEKIEAEEDTELDLPVLTIEDVDFANVDDMLQVAIAAHNGTLRIYSEVEIYEWVTGSLLNASKTLIIRGPITSMNEALKHISYQPDADYYGPDQIDVVISDMEHSGIDTMSRSNVNLSTTVIFPVLVKPVVDFPVINVTHHTNTIEDNEVRINALIFHGDSDETKVQVHILCQHGRIRLVSTSDITFIDQLNHNESFHLTGIGSVKAWNHAMKYIYYVPAPNWNSFNYFWDRIQWRVYNVDDPASADNKETLVQVDAVNDSPEWFVRRMKKILQGVGGSKIDSIDPMFVDEDSFLSIQPIILHEPDFFQGDSFRIQDFYLEFEVSATHGVLSLNDRKGLSFQRGKDLSEFMKFTCMVPDCNRAIYVLKYQPFHNFHGEDKIILHVSDMGNIGSGGVKMSNVSIPVIVRSVPDAPIVLIPYSFLACVQVRPCSVYNVSVMDPDRSDKLIVEVSSTGGHLSFPTKEVSNSQDTDVDTKDSLSNFARFIGNASQLNELLYVMIYTPDKGSQYFGRLEHIHMIVSSYDSLNDETIPSTVSTSIKIVVTTADVES